MIPCKSKSNGMGIKLTANNNFANLGGSKYSHAANGGTPLPSGRWLVIEQQPPSSIHMEVSRTVVPSHQNKVEVGLGQPEPNMPGQTLHGWLIHHREFMP